MLACYPLDYIDSRWRGNVVCGKMPFSLKGHRSFQQIYWAFDSEIILTTSTKLEFEKCVLKFKIVLHKGLQL